MKSGWEYKKLAQVVDFQRGLTYSKKDETDISSNIVLRANNIDLSSNTLDFSDLKYIKDQIKVPECKKVKIGSLIVCTASGSKSHLGKVALIDKVYDYSFGGFMGQITPHEYVNSKYLFYTMTSEGYKNFIEKLSSGVNINNLTFDKLGEYTFFLPPLPEQQRIVAILDQAFAAIATAKANTEKNLQNTRELYETFLQSVLINKNEKWDKKSLGEVFEIARGGSPRPISSYLTTSSDGINWIKIGDTKGITKYIYKTEEKIKPEGARRSRVVHEGDFILSNSMSFGKPYIMKTTGCIHDGWLVLSEKVKNIDKNFLYHVLGSHMIFQQFDRLAAGSTVRNLNIDLVKKVRIPMPSLPQQKELVAKLEEFSSETTKLERIYQQKMGELEELRSSTLQKAFNGEL